MHIKIATKKQTKEKLTETIAIRGAVVFQRRNGFKKIANMWKWYKLNEIKQDLRLT